MCASKQDKNETSLSIFIEILDSKKHLVEAYVILLLKLLKSMDVGFHSMFRQLMAHN